MISPSRALVRVIAGQKRIILYQEIAKLVT